MPGVPSLTPSAKEKPGLVAAWALKFSSEEPKTLAPASFPAPLQLSSSDYEGDLDLTLQSGLAAGTYKITLYGLSDDHYQAITNLNRVQLYLFYADNSGVMGYLSNLIGLNSGDPPDGSLVVDLRVNSVKRSVYVPPTSAGGSSGGASGSGAAGAGSSSGAAASVAPVAASTSPPPSSAAPAAASPSSSASGNPLRPPTYQYVIDVEERIYNFLNRAHRDPSKPAPVATTAHAAVDELLGHQLGLQADKQYKYWPPTSTPEPATHVSFPLEPTIAWQLGVLAKANGFLERANAPPAHAGGRGMLLIRDGVLHVGRRQIPLAGQPLDLTVETGLLQTTVASNAASMTSATAAGVSASATLTGAGVPTAGLLAGEAVAFIGSAAAAIANALGPPDRRQFTLILRGRPDIKPGDVVRFKLPPEDAKATTSKLGVLAAAADIITGLAGIDETPDTAMYVETSQHQLGRRTGFQTTLTGVEVNKDDPTDAWDASGRSTQPGEHATGPAAAAAAVHGATAQSNSANAQTLPDVAEVRAFTAVDPPQQDGQKAYDPTGQTEKLWVGLADESLKANAVRQMNVDHFAKVEATGVPYLTPFALGKCGLVLPRYPQTRVVLAYRKGDPHDPIDIGALWQSGHIPPGAAPGDWWLSLPAKLDGDPPSSLADDVDASPPDDYSGKISQDLIDGAGHRAIDVTSLRIRAGSDTLNDAGTKITTAPDGSALVIEHTKNGKTASITIKDDASIEISSDTKITFTSQGDIEMHAQNVNVHVSGHMDVAS